MKTLAIFLLFGRHLLGEPVAPVNHAAPEPDKHIRTCATTAVTPLAPTSIVSKESASSALLLAAAPKDTIILRLKNKNKLVMISNDGDLNQFLSVDLPTIVRKLDSSRAVDGTVRLADSTYRMKSRSYKVLGSPTITFVEVNRPINNWNLWPRDTNGKRVYTSTYSPKRTTHQFDIDFGLNMYLDNGKQVDGQAPYALDNLNSRYIAIKALNSTRIGAAKSPHRILYGVELSWYNFRYQKKVKIDQDETTGDLIWQTAPAGQPDYEASKLTVAYLNLPLMYYYYPKKGIRMGAGGYVGYKLDEYNKVEQDGKVIRGGRGDFNINTFQAGLRAQVGWRGVDIFCNYNLTPLFREGRGPVLTPIAFGINL